ncbi:alpha/beta hydrolase [Agrobacterium sp. LAD9]
MLIFVHGFNTTYADTVFRFVQIAHNIHVDAAPSPAIFSDAVERLDRRLW